MEDFIDIPTMKRHVNGNASVIPSVQILYASPTCSPVETKLQAAYHFCLTCIGYLKNIIAVVPETSIGSCQYFNFVFRGCDQVTYTHTIAFCYNNSITFFIGLGIRNAQFIASNNTVSMMWMRLIPRNSEPGIIFCNYFYIDWRTTGSYGSKTWMTCLNHFCFILSKCLFLNLSYFPAC